MTLPESAIRAGWKIPEADTDPGTGFFRFRMSDLPAVVGGAGGGTSNVVELFAVDLAAARAQLAQLVTKKTPIMRRPKDPEPITAQPIAHKATRLGKRQRREMAERAAAEAVDD